MMGDKWLLASAIQKSVRRGETERAERAAAALHTQDRRKLWQRLLVIALEDIGIGDPAVLVQVLRGVADTGWRRKDDRQAALHLTRLLCGAVKSRLSDSVLMQAERSPEYVLLRDQLGIADTAQLQTAMADLSQPLPVRALAIWLLAGTRQYPSDNLPQRVGSVTSAADFIRAHTHHHELAQACIGVIKRLPWPMALHIPLIWQELHGIPVTVCQYQLPQVPAVNGLPLYAADQFTRVGKSCYRTLQKAVSELSGFTAQQIGLSTFYIEGGLVDRELRSPVHDLLQQQGEATDIHGTGLTQPAYADLRHILTEAMPLLADIRESRLKRYAVEGA